MRELVLREPRCVQAGDVVRDIADDDAVVVLRIALRLSQPLASAERTAVEIGLLGRAAVELRDQPLGRHGHRVHGTFPVVDHFVRMTGGERAAGTHVARISTRRHVAGGQRTGHGGIDDDAAEGPAANRLKATIPAGGRHPDFDFDVGVG